MFYIFFRLLLTYFITVLSIRLMGKRQIGQLQTGEFVTMLFLSELSVVCVTDPNIPLTYGLIPVLTLISIEVILSFLSTKLPLFKRLLDLPPSILIRKGTINQRELKKNRITVEELFSQLRLKGIAHPSDCSYALLEPNGQISVFAKESLVAPNAKELGLTPKERGISHSVLEDGQENSRGMQGAEISREKLNELLRSLSLQKEELFYLCLNDEGEMCYEKKDFS